MEKTFLSICMVYETLQIQIEEEQRVGKGEWQMDNKTMRNKTTEDKTVEDKIVEEKIREEKTIEDKIREGKISEQKSVEYKATESKIAEHKVLQLVEQTICNRMIYKMVFIILLMLNIVPLLHEKVGSYVKLMLVWGIVILVWEFIRNPSGLFKVKGMAWLLAFAVSYGITILCNREAYFSENVKALCYMILFFLLFYGINRNKKRDSVIKEIHGIGWTVILTTFVLAIICFVMFLLSIEYKYVADGVVLRLGIHQNRLWGLYNPNVGATLNIISMFCSIVMLLEETNRHKLMRMFLIINSVLQYVCLVLTASRTAIYAMYIGIGMLVYFVCGVVYKKKIWKKAIIAIASMAVMFLAVTLTNKIMWQLPKLFPTVEVKASSLFSMNRKDTDKESNGGMLNGRQYMWTAGFQQFNDAPFFGVTREQVAEKVKKKLAFEEGMNKKTVRSIKRALKNGGVHNMYLTILVSSGLVGFVLFCGFVISYFSRILWYVQRIKVLKGNEWFLGTLVLCIIMLIMEMFENRILYQVNIFYALFWMLMGYAMYFAQPKSLEESLTV